MDNIDELINWMTEHGYSIYSNGARYYNTGYEAWYSKPDYDYILKEVRDGLATWKANPKRYSWITNKEELISDIVHERMYSYFINSRG